MKLQPSTLALAAGLLLRSFARADDDDDDDTPLPVVIWHGLGDTFDGEGMQHVASLADAVNPGTFVYNIALGDDASADRTATFFGNVTSQLETVCDALASHPILSTAPAIDAIGFSQGGQFLRGYVERCNRPPVRSLVTFGSQHNGISEFHDCPPSDLMCRGAMALLRFNTFSSFVQSRLVPAQYFRDPLSLDAYLESSNFLADINNERPVKNPKYAANMASLSNFVMYMFEDDTTVVPRESSLFAEVNGTDVTPLRKRSIYKSDWLGLSKIDAKGGLRFRSIPGQHMHITEEALNDTIKSYFGPFGRTFTPETEIDSLDEL